MSTPRDTGDFLEVPASDRLDVDVPDPSEDNVDAFQDLSAVPDGEYKELSTASEDEPVGDEEENL